jgi:2OG-Fe(II) oxygenase superfamily
MAEAEVEQEEHVQAAVAAANAMMGGDEDEPDSIIKELLYSMNKERLNRIAENHRAKYLANAPFPNMAFDGLFPEAIVRAVEKEIPENNFDENGCYKGAPRNKCYLHDKSFKKTGLAQDDLMGPYTRVFMAVLKSANFVGFLERLTGIEHIVPDPRFYGSGVHVIAKDGYLGVHADFNWNPGLALHRRVNCFVFLNPDWDEEWGGHLEFWNKEMDQCHQRIAPHMGRFAVFSTTDFTYHGHPNPLATPDDRARRSMALYYYTATRPAYECINEDCTGHNTVTLHQDIKGDCHDCHDPNCNALPKKDVVVQVDPWIPGTQPKIDPLAAGGEPVYKRVKKVL